MLLCNPAFKQPTAALMQPYRIHPIGQIPYRNPAILRSGNRSTNQANLIPPNGPFQNHRYCTSTLFCCQSIRNLLTVFRVNVLLCQGFQYLASRALPSMFTTWQAMHTCMIWYLASMACTYRFCYLASRVQNAICEIAHIVRVAVHYLASSVQIRTCAQFLHRLVGNTSQTQRSHFV